MSGYLRRRRLKWTHLLGVSTWRGSSGSSGSGGGSESLEAESKFVEEWEAGDDVEVRSSKHVEEDVKKGSKWWCSHCRARIERGDEQIGYVLRPVLEYRTFDMVRNLAFALVETWVPRSKAFMLPDRLVPFSVFDVALLTALPIIGERVKFDDDSVMTKYGKMVRARVQKAKQEDLRKKKVGEGRKDTHVYKNFIAAMVYLSWELERYANDVNGMNRYAWIEAVWRYLVQCLDDMQQRLCNPVSQIQFNRCCLLLQCDCYERRTFHNIVSSSEEYHGGWCDVFEVVAGIKEDEIVPVLHPWEVEREEPIVRDFMEMDEFKYYMEDAEGVISFEERLQCVKDCLYVQMDVHVVTCAELDLCKVRVAKLRAMVHNQGREAKKRQYMASNMYVDGDDIGPYTTKVELATERDIRLNVAAECVGNSVTEETGKGKQLLGAVTMTAASDKDAAPEVENEVSTAAVEDT
ncbi:hypothetical protein Cgig2_021117 [Carnegiea gigantea]|uniref:Aminotransferase-like plant mobile domain-containing protein n=1 Tax=Carnegiea gigantea TaxID=171969 RepID=A0A9Q1JWW7_9CARY|nr:hypothetical protein Cgig2_021117 [Carnegiea gigantea]